MHCEEIIEFGKPLVSAERPTPVPTGTEILVKVRAAGVCHTDLHIWHGGYDLGGGNMLKMAERGVRLPHILGHENVGEVVAVGPDVGAVPVGAVRLVYPWIGCGQCRVCLAGEEQLCAKPQSIGVFRSGGYADHMIVPHPRYLFDIGAIPAASAAPIACSGLTVYSALKKLGDRIAADPILIVGAGGLGLMAIGVLRAMGGKGAIVADLDPKKREAALAAGALAVVDPADGSAGARIVELAGGAPLPGAVDFVGAPATVQLALASLAKGGRLVMVGLFGGKIELPLPPIALRAVSIIGSFTGSLPELRELLDLFRNGAVAPIPTTIRSLDQANATLEDLQAGRLVGRGVLVP